MLLDGCNDAIQSIDKNRDSEQHHGGADSAACDHHVSGTPMVADRNITIVGAANNVMNANPANTPAAIACSLF
ncbi:hypothetical protein [Mesorhizobium sp.]|uniref:hypothetical protein n=1 Tax=Mesorhizobium sp. TaxID=1871066 RepID=UPI000FE88576|nr:hypothetical protein [Mesorhizobium sp.]RWE68084.1 MAG: hypothetical protein EOS62_12140 [Mesorhizobium sp.]